MRPHSTYHSAIGSVVDLSSTVGCLDLARAKIPMERECAPVRHDRARPDSNRGPQRPLGKRSAAR